MDFFLRIGDVAVAVRHADPALFVDPAPPLRNFLVDRVADPDLTIDVVTLDEYEPPRGPLLFDSGVVWTLFENGDSYRIECRSHLYGDLPYKLADVDRDFEHAVVRVRRTGARFADALEYPLDELLVNALVAARGGIELHSCGVIDRDGAGYLFAGNSGDGKTTTARLWEKAGATVLSDDRIIVRPSGDRWWMYGTPWHGEAEIASAARAPLRHVFTIDSSARRNAATTPTRADAVARLFACAFPPFHDPARIGGVIATIDRLAASVPVTRLSFSNDASAVDFVRSVASRRIMSA